MTRADARDPALLVSLITVALGLVAVGAVSGTVIRHLIQAAPALAVAALAVRGDPRARFAALPVFALWFLIMLGIWLFLLGIARVLTGQFSPAEIVLTLVIGGGCVAGMSRALRRGPPAGWLAAAIAFVLAAALQVTCVWLSLQPAVAHR